MSKQEKLNLIKKLDNGLKASYDSLLRRKAAMGQDMVIADASGKPVIVPAAELLAQKKDN